MTHRRTPWALGAGFVALALLWTSGASLAASGTRSSSFAYDPVSGLLIQEVVEPSAPASRLQTDTVYDAYGNKTSVTISGADIASRAITTTFSLQGQFAITRTNALGQAENFQYDARFGMASSQTGPNGLTTTFQYDGFGRKVLEVRADGNQTQTAYLYCSGTSGGTATCPSGAAYLMQTTPQDASGAQNGPITKTYYDTLDRKLATDAQGFDGSTVRQSVQYDAFGRVSQTSRPYFLSGGTPKWSVMTYDALGRVTVATLPDGSTTTNTYHGLVLTQVNGLSQPRITTKNGQGQIVSVQDALNGTTSFAYDPFGNMTSSTDPAGNVITNTYDSRGRKISTADPDLGMSSYHYDVVGDLLSQTDAKGQTTTYSYDLLGRPIQRIEADLTSTWVYDTAPMGVGKLATESTNGSFQRVMSYDSLGRPSQVTSTIDGTAYTISGTYDANGRAASAIYPSGFSTTNVYTALGYQSQLINTATSAVYWQANARDAEANLTQQSFGNGIATTQSFDANTGRLLGIQAGPGNAVQNANFTWNVIGTLTARADATQSLGETFVYDALNRLTTATIVDGPSKSFSYDSIGNLLGKTGVGNYAYDPVRAHAVTSITDGTIVSSFTYDANGNQLTGMGRTIGYSSFNKPTSITQGTVELLFTHDTNHDRYKQVGPSGTTLYLAGFGIMAEKVTNGTTIQWKNYLFAAGRLIAQQTESNAAVTTTRYLHKDHLGSTAVITDENGLVVERSSFDSWGKRRYPTGADDTTNSITSQTNKGYTGHEELDSVTLVHMNGRVYDPTLGRFTSADPYIPDPLNVQAFNRYSYVQNNPLSLTDPSGYFSLGGLLTSIIRGGIFGPAAFIPGIGKQIDSFVAKNSWAQTLIMMQSAACLQAAAVCAAANAAYIAGVKGGSLGDMLLAGAVAAAQTYAFQQVGTYTNGHYSASAGGFSGIDKTVVSPSDYFLSADHIANIAGHAAIGCASAAASKGNCGAGALATGVSAFAGPQLATANAVLGGTASAVIGGTASVIAGGKFQNGAVSAAFGYLFNTCRNLSGCINPESKGPGMVDVSLGDGRYMWAPPGAAADIATAALQGKYAAPGDVATTVKFLDNLSTQAGYASALSASTVAGEPAAIAFGVISAGAAATSFVLNPTPVQTFGDAVIDVVGAALKVSPAVNPAIKIRG